MNKINQTTYALAMRELLSGPVTAHEIAEETGLHIVTAQSLMRTLHDNDVVHISTWEPDRLGRDCTPVYKLGSGRDAKRRSKTRAQIAADYRERKAIREAVNAVVIV